MNSTLLDSCMADDEDVQVVTNPKAKLVFSDNDNDVSFKSLPFSPIRSDSSQNQQTLCKRIEVIQMDVVTKENSHHPGLVKNFDTDVTLLLDTGEMKSLSKGLIDFFYGLDENESVVDEVTYPEFTSICLKFNVMDIEDGPDVHKRVKESYFRISKVAFQNNKQCYLLNSGILSKKDLFMELKNKSIEWNNSIFLADVQTISDMPPKNTDGKRGLLEFIELFLGYDDQKSKLSEVVKKLNDLAFEEITLMKELETQYLMVEAKRKKNEKYFALEQEIMYKKHLLYLKSIVKHSDAEEELKKVSASLSTETEHLTVAKEYLNTLVENRRVLEK